MKFHNLILKCYGLKGIIDGKYKDNDIDHDVEFANVVISIDESSHKLVTNVINTKIPFYKKTICRNILNYFYMTFVLSIIGWPCVYSIINSGINHNSNYFTSSIFSFMYLAQYITGVLLYKEKYFSDAMKTIKDHSTIMISIYVIMSLIALALSITAGMLLIFDVNVNIYTVIYNNANLVGKIFILIAIVFHKLYSYNVFFVNIITFTYILTNHSRGIKSYKNKLNTIINENTSNICINDIIKEYTELKKYHSESVNYLNNMFTSTTLIGVIAAYFIVMDFETNFVGVFTYCDIIFFICVEGIYLYVINKIKSSVNDIKTIISSMSFVIKFLDRSDLVDMRGDVYQDYKKNDGDEEDAIYSKKINTANILTPRSSNVQNIISIIDEVNSTHPDINKKINVIKNIVLRNYIITHENAVETDWIILYTKLSEPWDYFAFFGFEIDDVQIIQKLTVIVIGLIGILRLNAKIGF